MCTGIAIVGCGFVADFYVKQLAGHPQLALRGAYDIDPDRNARFAAFHETPAYESLDALLNDPNVSIVVNLTSPISHYDISSRAIAAGKHVYSEKPIALTIEQVRALHRAAAQAGLRLSSAPCCVLGESAQTLWKAIRDGVVGNVRLVYAQIDYGPIHRMPHDRWRSVSGTPWPFHDEMQLGCVRGHAGYAVTRLCAMFGPVREVTAFSSRLVSPRANGSHGGGNGNGCVHADECGPDLAVASLTFDSGVVARLTCGIVASADRSLLVFGDDGILSVGDLADDRSTVRLRRYVTIRRRLLTSPWAHRMKLLRSPARGTLRYQGLQRRDFARGIAELADAISEGRESRLSPAFCLHTNEVVLAIHASGGQGAGRHEIESTFAPMAPMTWATC